MSKMSSGAGYRKRKKEDEDKTKKANRSIFFSTGH